MGVNKVIVVGNLGQDPEMRFTPNGSPYTNLRVAASRRYYDSDRNLVEETEWFNIVTWGKLAERCNQYLSKGRLVYVEGRFRSRTWTDANGNKRERFEIVADSVQFLGRGASDIVSGDMAIVEQLGEEGIEIEVEDTETVPKKAATSAGRSKRKIVKPAQ